MSRHLIEEQMDIKMTSTAGIGVGLGQWWGGEREARGSQNSHAFLQEMHQLLGVQAASFSSSLRLCEAGSPIA